MSDAAIETVEVPKLSMLNLLKQRYGGKVDDSSEECADIADECPLDIETS